MAFPFAIDFDALGISRAAYSAFLIAFAAYSAVFLAVELALYILRAVGIYKMALNAGIKQPWIAFVPVANAYTFGLIAEKNNRKKTTEKTKFSVVLLTLRIIGTVFFVAAAVTFVIATSKILTFAYTAYENDTNLSLEALGSIVLPIVLFAVFTLVTLAFIIIRYIALWRIYNAYDSSNAAAYTVVSVLFNFTDPIFLFILRNRTPMFGADAENEYTGSVL